METVDDIVYEFNGNFVDYCLENRITNEEFNRLTLKVLSGMDTEYTLAHKQSVFKYELDKRIKFQYIEYATELKEVEDIVRDLYDIEIYESEEEALDQVERLEVSKQEKRMLKKAITHYWCM